MRKKQLLEERAANNLTDDKYWSTYYRYYKQDLNSTLLNDTKPQRKPMLDIRLKSKRRKQHQNHANKVLANQLFDISTSTAPTTLSFTPFVTVESTTAGITTAATELRPYYRDGRTSEINSQTRINDRMSLNDLTSTSRINEIPTTTTKTTTTTPTIITTTPKPSTTEHSITYNVTVENPKPSKPRARKLSNAAWGRWQKWTKCSRSCGGGVMSQSRHCLSR